MKFLENFLKNQGRHFEKGGKLEKLYPLYEAIDTFAFTPSSVNKADVHVRDSIDLKRVMMSVAWALTPVLIFAMYNTGYQTLLALAGTTGDSIQSNQMTDVVNHLHSLDLGWRADILKFLGLRLAFDNILSCFVYGALYFVPIFLVTNIVGGLIELLFASVRGHEINEGFLVTGILFPLILPATIPLWQVAIGIAFGVIIGKEIFGGTGKNIFNPALTARAFLFFAYPAQISGDSVWIAVDGVTRATPLAEAALGGQGAISVSWWEAFIGLIPGSIGETSALLCALGAIYLIYVGIASWRIILGVILGMLGMSLLLNAIGSASNPFFSVSPQWHIVLGGFAFATAFMATDPVSAAMTNTGRWIYGLCIGVLGVLIRVINPAYPEGWMLAILFMNAFVPLIDYFVMKSNINRRRVRNGQ